MMKGECMKCEVCSTSLTNPERAVCEGKCEEKNNEALREWFGSKVDPEIGWDCEDCGSTIQVTICFVGQDADDATLPYEEPVNKPLCADCKQGNMDEGLIAQT
jgi:hypothetical protein